MQKCGTACRSPIATCLPAPTSCVGHWNPQKRLHHVPVEPQDKACSTATSMPPCQPCCHAPAPVGVGPSAQQQRCMVIWQSCMVCNGAALQPPHPVLPQQNPCWSSGNPTSSSTRTLRRCSQHDTFPLRALLSPTISRAGSMSSQQGYRGVGCPAWSATP